MELVFIVSIPFIAGQWSLRATTSTPGNRLQTFQSPSLRGSGRFTTPFSASLRCCASFQSPSLRGSGRFTPATRLWTASPSSFNPLHCGAVVASCFPLRPPYGERCDNQEATTAPQ